MTSQNVIDEILSIAGKANRFAHRKGAKRIRERNQRQGGPNIQVGLLRFTALIRREQGSKRTIKKKNLSGEPESTPSIFPWCPQEGPNAPLGSIWGAQGVRRYFLGRFSLSSSWTCCLKNEEKRILVQLRFERISFWTHRHLWKGEDATEGLEWKGKKENVINNLRRKKKEKQWPTNFGKRRSHFLRQSLPCVLDIYWAMKEKMKGFQSIDEKKVKS